ncbi:MAG: PQQ-like beta-propeller repeat protein [Planctomycetia bacterium]|nr:PQQ-like beta-propeller repeat protein [Planctomycetia bacterium]
MAFSRISPITRVKVLASCVVLIVGFSLATYVDGYHGDGRPILTWRSLAPVNRESKLPSHLAEVDGGTPGSAIDLSATTELDSPQFRGSDRSGIVRGVRLSRDWSRTPPKLLWWHPIGMGWSSFAVRGDFCVTQEQWGEEEVVACYELRTGRARWVHRDTARFHEVTGGDGPRATPTIQGGRVFALGATGILNCLDGSNGRPIWSRNILADAKVKNRPFGMASSPLVLDGMVVVCPGGKGRSLVAYEEATGKFLWGCGDSPAGYSSPVSTELAGARQILNFNADGLFAHDIHTGRLLWNFPWLTPPEMNNVCQPIPLPTDSSAGLDRVFISSGYNKGSAVLGIKHDADGFHVESQWANKELKAKFSSCVIHDGFVYGLDERILTCLDLRTGTRRWKSGRYGYGQLVLVDDLLLIQADSGGIALVEASPDAHRELARFPALEHRTWNYPVVAGSLLLVRNDREAACYELPLDEGSAGK